MDDRSIHGRVGGDFLMNQAVKTEAYTLLTFQPMVDSECTRLILAYHKAPFVERDHMIGLGSIIGLLRSGNWKLPLVYGNGVKLISPRPVAEHFDSLVPPERRLIPTGEPIAAQVEEDWATYNGGIGAYTAQFAYWHLLPERKVMTRIFKAPVPWFERKITGPLYPLQRLLLNKGLGLSAKGAQEAIDKIRGIIDRTDKRIADGRPYLCGDRITLGDPALASSMSALLKPKGYKPVLPTPEETPPVLRSAMEELQQRPTAAFVQRFYDRHAAPLIPD